MREGDSSDFSRLKTVSRFDQGTSSTAAVDLTTTPGLPKSSPPSLFVESLLEQLCKLFEKDPLRQRTLYLAICQQLHKMNLIDESYKIDEFQYMRSHYQKALYHFLSVAKSTLAENKTIYPASSILNLRSDDILEWSRYSTEFRELKFIAKGGFGHVFKSQNLLDGGIYAIKKLFLSYRSINGFLQNLREVKMLARLNHPNIVAYKAAWLEPLESNTTKTKKDVPAISEVQMEVSNGDSLEVVFEHSSKEVSVQGSIANDDKSSSSVIGFSDSRSPTPLSGSSLAESKDGIICEYKSKREKKQHYKFTYTSTMGSRSTNCAILFIQMQLCQLTLRQWLDERNQLPHDHTDVNHGPTLFDIRNSLEIFKQIVRGVQYIHSQGIVHHDIKPSNIFVSMDLKQVQVGDFGLSCLLSHSQSPSPSTSPASSPRPSGSLAQRGYTSHQLGQYGGTKLYAAPEQMKNMCHPKSDIYSLGLVLLELIKPFQTAMERCKVLSQLKAGQVPPDIASTWPHLALIIRRTISGRLDKRPTATELLTELEESEKTNTALLIEHQKDVIKILTQENQAIRQQNVEKDKEIESLKRRLDEIIFLSNLSPKS